jgi:phosphatidate cytidylyltransferase
MRERIIVGLIALPAVLIPIWLGGVWAALFAVLAGVGGGVEFYRLMQIGGYQPSRILGLLWLALLILSNWQPQYLPFSLILMAGMIVTFIDAMHQKEMPISAWMATGMGALYFSTMLGQALALRQLPNGLWWVYMALALTWMNDSAAYFVGVSFGKNKIWPRLSPKKTWEGTIAGWVTAAVVGALWIIITPLNATYSPFFGAIIGVFAGVLAFFGDLSISTLKRQVGVKDTGNLFRGHGGLLDRLDSLLFVFPFVYQVVLLWG